jgi:hypothetical protein
LKAVRRHWGIESFHWDLDKSFGEDACKVKRGYAAEAFSFMRKLAFNLIAPLRFMFGMSLPLIQDLLTRHRGFLEAVLEKDLKDANPNVWRYVSQDDYMREQIGPPANWEARAL